MPSLDALDFPGTLSLPLFSRLVYPLIPPLQALKDQLEADKASLTEKLSGAEGDLQDHKGRLEALQSELDSHRSASENHQKAGGELAKELEDLKAAHAKVRTCRDWRKCREM